MLFSSTSYNGSSMIDFPSYCKIDPHVGIPMGIAIIKDNNKLRAIYDSNSVDEKKCYNAVDNRGIYNITTLWEVDIGSNDWEFVNADNYIDYYLPPSSVFCLNNFGMEVYYSDNMYFIVHSDEYRYYIKPTGQMFKKFKMEKIIKTYGLGCKDANRISYYSEAGPFAPYNNYMITDQWYNNGTIMMSKNNVYINNYIVRFEEPQTCRVVDIDIQKIYSFKDINV